jgi:hypothetical protein
MAGIRDLASISAGKSITKKAAAYYINLLHNLH